MSLENTLNQAITAIDGLRQTVDGKITDIDARVASAQAQVDQFVTDASEKWGGVNLLTNSRFMLDSNGDGFPDNFYTFYSAAGTASYTLIGPDPNAAAGSDARIADELKAISVGPTTWHPTEMKILKVSLPASTTTGADDVWSLNQICQLGWGKYTRGLYLYVKTTGSAHILISDNPGGADTPPLDPATQFNVPVKLYAQGETEGERLGFILRCLERTAPVDLYIALPFFVNGHVDRWMPAPGNA